MITVFQIMSGVISMQPEQLFEPLELTLMSAWCHVTTLIGISSIQGYNKTKENPDDPNPVLTEMKRK